MDDGTGLAIWEREFTREQMAEKRGPIKDEEKAFQIDFMAVSARVVTISAETTKDFDHVYRKQDIASMLRHCPRIEHLIVRDAYLAAPPPKYPDSYTIGEDLYKGAAALWKAEMWHVHGMTKSDVDYLESKGIQVVTEACRPADFSFWVKGSQFIIYAPGDNEPQRCKTPLQLECFPEGLREVSPSKFAYEGSMEEAVAKLTTTGFVQQEGAPDHSYFKSDAMAVDA
jgi:hypothetical protein